MSCIEDTASVDLEIDGGVLTAEVIISPQPNNQLSELADGLFVGLSVPPAVVVPFAGAAAPSNWLLCDGSAVNRSTYAALFAIIGVVYGSGDGSTTFNLPDLRGRVAVGLGTHADIDALAESDGEAVGSRRPKHKHTQDGGYKLINVGTGTGYAGGGGDGVPNTSTVGPQTLAPTDAPAYLVLNYIIKT